MKFKKTIYIGLTALLFSAIAFAGWFPNIALVENGPALNWFSIMQVDGEGNTDHPLAIPTLYCSAAYGGETVTIMGIFSDAPLGYFTQLIATPDGGFRGRNDQRFRYKIILGDFSEVQTGYVEGEYLLYNHTRKGRDKDGNLVEQEVISGFKIEGLAEDGDGDKLVKLFPVMKRIESGDIVTREQSTDALYCKNSYLAQ